MLSWQYYIEQYPGALQLALTALWLENICLHYSGQSFNLVFDQKYFKYKLNYISQNLNFNVKEFKLYWKTEKEKRKLVLSKQAFHGHDFSKSQTDWFELRSSNTLNDDSC